ncbi:MAG TPA: conjugal transfer protein TraI [Segetibacter sp.]
MKKIISVIVLVAFATLEPSQKVLAQDPITEIIKAGVKKVIKAVDLKIQRLQNKTIWLQNAQKVIENTMSEMKLNEITDWVEKQRTLYKDYYDELWQVKNSISYYHRVKEITSKQVQLVAEYKRAWGLFKQDKHFTGDELNYMGRVYTGILDESVKNLEQIFLVVNSFSTQMSDAKRLEIINNAYNQVETNYLDLKAFNQQNVLVSLQRAKSKNDIDVLKALYGLH